MSNRSELYHCFGLGVVEVLGTSFAGGATIFRCRHPEDRICCAVCQSTDEDTGNVAAKRRRKRTGRTGGEGRRHWGRKWVFHEAMGFVGNPG